MEIIVLQTTGFDTVRSLLEHCDVDQGQIKYFTIPSQSAEAITPDTPQILILGAINGTTSQAGEFVKEMKAKNPQLKTISFSSSGEVPGCNAVVPKIERGALPKLLDAIKTLSQS